MGTQLCRSKKAPRSIGTVRVNNEIGVGVVLEAFAHLLPVADIRSFTVILEAIQLWDSRGEYKTRDDHVLPGGRAEKVCRTNQ
jgi:hypothetical protein